MLRLRGSRLSRLLSGKMIPKKVHISGTVDAFRIILEDRLLRAGASITDEPNSADITVSMGEESSAEIAIVATDSHHGEADLVVRVHDLLVPEGAHRWGSQTIYQWADWVMDGADGEPIYDDPRHWVHVRDATDALAILILSENTTSGIIDLCGRRPWSRESIITELSLLWGRFTDAVQHTHTVSSLTGSNSPVTSEETHTIRPDLGPLHKALLRAGGDGWRPVVPMRVSLMEILAHRGEGEDSA